MSFYYVHDPDKIHRDNLTSFLNRLSDSIVYPWSRRSWNRLILTQAEFPYHMGCAFQELERRASNGDLSKFKALMAKVPDATPMEGDEL